MDMIKDGKYWNILSTSIWWNYTTSEGDALDVFVF